MNEITLDRQIAAVRDEIALRRRVYPRFVAGGKMTQEVADRRIAEMQAAQATLERLRDAEKKHRAPGLFDDADDGGRVDCGECPNVSAGCRRGHCMKGGRL